MPKFFCMAGACCPFEKSSPTATDTAIIATEMRILILFFMRILNVFYLAEDWTFSFMKNKKLVAKELRGSRHAVRAFMQTRFRGL